MARPDAKYMGECTLKYDWFHIPTEKYGIREMTFPFPRTIAMKMLTELIDKWNAQQPQTWRYRKNIKNYK